MKKQLASAIAALFVMGAGVAEADGVVTLIHTGDFHGHLTPRPNLRNGAPVGQTIGGLARIKTKIQEIQAGKGGAGNTLVMHTGDTIQGSGEALYTRGQAMVDVADMLGIDAYAPGNWDFVYGPERFKELFASSLNPHLANFPDQANGTPPPAGTRWGGLSANLYVASKHAPASPTSIGSAQDSNVSASEYEAYASWYANDLRAQRVLPPYTVKTVNGVKIGIVGCTTSRGPQVVGSWVTTGLAFTDCAREVPKFAAAARADGAEVVVLVSEIEIGRNIAILKQNITNASQHVDVVLNSDMHEEILKPIEVTNGAGKKTWIIESGMDGTLVGEVTLSVHAGEVIDMQHTPHPITDAIVEDTAVANKVAEVSYPFNAGFTPNTHLNPFSGTYLNGPLSDEVGHTDVALHRSNYSHENMPAAIEGSSHDFIADAIRWWAQSDMATVRGFRYGTHVKPGAITRNDLFHFVPIGPRVGKASRVVPNQIRNQIDNSSLAVFSTNPNVATTPLPRYNNGYGDPASPLYGTSPGAGLTVRGTSGNSLGWGGGWLFAYSAEDFHFDFAPYFEPAWQKVKAPGTVAGVGTDPATNIQTTAAATDTSRARSFSVKMLCKYLPPLEQAAKACNVADLSNRYSTTLTKASDGSWTPAWGNTLVSQGSTAKQVYLLNPEGWQYLQGLANQPNQANAAARPFQLPTFTVAGYWYAQSPDTINNCNNCLATGFNTTVGHKDAAYLLPVNANAEGKPALDVDGNPIFVRDASGNVVWENDVNGKRKPKIEGQPIDLTVIVEKYLAHLGAVTADNLKLNRIGLVANDGVTPITLPDFTNALGFPVMQPLCGLIGKDATSAVACPQ